MQPSDGSWEILDSVGDESYDIDWYSFQLTAADLCPEHNKPADTCLLCEADEEGQLTECPRCGRRWLIIGDGCYNCGLIADD